LSPRAYPVELTILMPCLNEVETVAACIDKASRFLREKRIARALLLGSCRICA